MNLDEAWRTLGLAPTDDTALLRRRYADRLRLLHPDRSTSTDAHERTVAITAAYRTILTHLAREQTASPPALVPLAVDDDQAITVGLAPEMTFELITDAADRLGEITHLDPQDGLVQVTIDFLEAPACQLIASIEAAGPSATLVRCHLASLDSAAPPPLRAVVGLLVAEVVRVTPTRRSAPGR